MNASRRSILKAASLTAGATLIPAIARAQTKQVINYGGSGWLGHYPAWVAMKAGFFAKRGVEVNFQSFATSSARLGAMLAGHVDLGCTGFVSAVPLMSRGARQISLLGSFSDSTKLEGLVAQPGIKSIPELKGKKIATSFASTAHLLLLDLLNAAGLNPDKDVTLVNIGGTEMATAMQSKQVDAVVAWTPQLNKIMQFPGVTLLANDANFSLYAKFGVTPVPDVLVGHREFMKKNVEAVRQFYAAFSEGCVALVEDPERCAKYVTELTNIGQAEQVSIIKDVQWNRASNQKELLSPQGKFVQGLQSLADMMATYKLIEKSPRVIDWIDGSFA